MPDASISLEARGRYQRFDAGRLGLMRLQQGCAGSVKLVCFPFAGGGPLAFRHLLAYLPKTWNVWAVDPPGHVRTGGDPLSSVDEMCELYLRELGSLMDNAILLGHSLGGYVAWSLAARCESEGHPVSAVLIGGVQPPHRRDPRKPLTTMSDAELFEWIIAIGGMPDAALDSRELFELYRHAIRSDCVAFEAFEPPSAPLRSTPVRVLLGSLDPIAPPCSAGEWTRYAERVEVAQVHGGHIFVTDNPSQVAASLLSLVRAIQGSESKC